MTNPNTTSTTTVETKNETGTFQTPISEHKGTTIVGVIVALLGYLLSPEFAAQSGVTWADILPKGAVPFVGLLGTIIAMYGPSLKKKQ